MLKTLSPPAELRHIYQNREFLGKTGTILAFTHLAVPINGITTVALLDFGTKKRLIPLLINQKDIKTGQKVQVWLMKLGETPDRRIIHGLCGYKI